MGKIKSICHTGNSEDGEITNSIQVKLSPRHSILIGKKVFKVGQGWKNTFLSRQELAFAPCPYLGLSFTFFPFDYPH